ncbi:MAG: SDR family oxidoreductase [Roseibium sp.]
MNTCLITAVNRGIGLELARAALADGWTVYGSVRNKGAAQEVADIFGEQVQLVEFDVTDNEAIQRAAAQVEADLDLLINNAGIIGPLPQSPLDMDFAGFQQTLAVNTLGPLAVSQAFLAHLRKGTPGSILTISSQMSWMGYRDSDRIAYRASKSAVNKVMQGLATELEPDGIPVALIDPGWVKTDMGGPTADNNPRDVAEGVIKIAKRLGPEDTGKFFKWTGEERPF